MNDAFATTQVERESRSKLRWFTAVLFVIFLVIAWCLLRDPSPPLAPIKIGLLHSKSGPAAPAEKALLDGELLAIDEINARGGLLGRRIEPVMADGKSDWPTYATEAERLISTEKVCTIFGCLTSASRKSVKPVVEKYRHLLIYPMSYEGLELSPNIIYTGATPNQQITPAVKWSLDHIGPRFFLVGSDYIWPRSINAIIKDELKVLGAELVGEDYVLFGGSDFQAVIQKIKEAKPDVILSSVVGDSNAAFYRELKNSGLGADKLPVVSVSIGEDALRGLAADTVTGHYCGWSYFQSIKRPRNYAFIKRFQSHHGNGQVTADPTQTAYFSVMLWAQAVQESGSTDVHRIRETMRGQSMDAPEGIVSVDPETQHTWRSFCMGKIRDDGQFDIVWTAQKPIRPVPYPAWRSRTEWDSFLANLNKQWEGQWVNPGKEN